MQVSYYPAPPPPGPPSRGGSADTGPRDAGFVDAGVPYDLAVALDDIVATSADLELPNFARTLDRLLGGGANFAVDRAAVTEMLRLDPLAEARARANRAFTRRMVRWAAARGIDQFVDLGCGIPSIQSVHGFVQAAAPGSRVLYVDLDPVAVAHARGLVADVPGVAVAWGDLRAPACILTAPEARGLLDLDRPVAVLACGVLHFVHDDIAALLGSYRAALAPGSVVAATYGLQPAPRSELVTMIDGVFSRGLAGVSRRPEEEVRQVLATLEPVGPGVVDVVDWPHAGAGGAHPMSYLAAVGEVRGG